jgi:hypothetical protein
MLNVSRVKVMNDEIGKENGCPVLRGYPGTFLEGK